MTNEQTISTIEANRIDPPEVAMPSEPGADCGNCERPLRDHTTATNVEFESVTICPETDEGRNVIEATNVILRIVKETSKRVGGIKRDGSVSTHFSDDVLVALWKLFGHDDCVYDERETDPEDDEYAGRGGHYRGCRGENCGC